MPLHPPVSLSVSLSLYRFLGQVHSCAALHLSVSRDRWRIFPGYQQRRAEMPTVWERKVCLPTDTWCHFRMERAGWLSGRPPGRICCFERGKRDNDFEKKKKRLVITCWLSKCHNFFPSALKLYNELTTAHFETPLFWGVSSSVWRCFSVCLSTCITGIAAILMHYQWLSHLFSQPVFHTKLLAVTEVVSLWWSAACYMKRGQRRRLLDNSVESGE